MQHLCVAGKDVQVGDYLYNPPVRELAAKKAKTTFLWVRVTAIEPVGLEGYEDYLRIHTTTWSTWKHRQAGVNIRRMNNGQSDSTRDSSQ